jgi:hypothetical protein
VPLQLGGAVDSIGSETQAAGALNDWLNGQPKRRDLDMSGLANWTGLVIRFRFYSNIP